METHRTLHDFGELSFEDISHIRSAPHELRSYKEKLRANLYSTILVALGFGILIGYLARRN